MSQADDSSFETEICSICLENVGSDDYSMIKECNHIFHYACIRQWVMVSNLCPVCRSCCT